MTAPVILFGVNLLERNPELGKRFMVVYLKGVKQFNQGKTERNLAILEKYFRIDKEVLRKGPWHTINPDRAVDARSLVDYQDWLYSKGYIDTKVNLEDIVGTRFIDYANRILRKE